MAEPRERPPIELTVSAEEAGERIDRILSARPLGFSRSALQSFIAEGRVTMGGKVVRASAKVAAGALVIVRPLPPPPSDAIPQDIPLEILFEDAHLIVLMKPAGLVVHPAPGHRDGTLVNALRFHVEVAEGDPERPGIVHRLDRDTSGVMVVAKTELAREGLIAQLKAHDIDREYVAIVQGQLKQGMRIETLHGRDPRDRKKFTTRVREGKTAVTRVEPVESLVHASLVRCLLETGRTHQIRVHLSEHGYPLLGDPVYGKPSQDPRVRAASDALGRQALHARVLGFRHPATGAQVRFEAEPPADFARALTALRVVLCAALCTLGLASRAQAAPDAQTFTPAAGEVTAFSTAEPEVLPHAGLSLGLSSSYARRPLVRSVDCALAASDRSCIVAGGETPVVRDLAQVELLAAVGVLDVLELGLALPFAWGQVVDDFAQPTRLLGTVALSDARLSARVPLVRGDFAAALALTGTLPTGDADVGFGSQSFTLWPAIVVRQRIDALTLAGSIGYRARERVAMASAQHAFEQDDELDASLALALRFTALLSLRAEARGRFGVFGRSARSEEQLLEGTLGAGLDLGPQAELLVGLGSAVPGTDVGYGSPALRCVLALRYTWASGRAARAAAPVAHAPDDEDGDGVRDPLDICARAAEDRDGFVDDDGCPDLDDDADGLRDASDTCPRASEDLDGFEDQDGCPEPDNDADAIEDSTDACSMDPEDKDGFEDGDGCPEPGPKPVTVSIEEGRILVSERIYFEHDRDVLRAVSFPALDRVVEAIATLSKKQIVRVEGHTDASGNAEYDLDISYRRARAVVEYLVRRGVPEAQLSYRGYGAERPIAPGSAPEVRALNRRVELVLEK